MKKYFTLFLPLFFLLSCKNNNTANKEGDSNDSVASVMNKSFKSMAEKGLGEMEGQQKNEKPAANPYKDAKIDIQVFKNDTVKQDIILTGFGYNILIFDAMYVHQPHIPAINGNRGFKTKEQATKAAEFVIYKIRNNIMPPSLSVEELDSLGVLQ